MGHWLRRRCVPVSRCRLRLRLFSGLHSNLHVCRRGSKEKEPRHLANYNPNGRNAVPIKQGIFKQIDSESTMDVGEIVQRIKSWTPPYDTHARDDMEVLLV